MPDTWAPNPKIALNDVRSRKYGTVAARRDAHPLKDSGLSSVCTYYSINAEWRLPQKESETEHCQSVYVSWAADNELNLLCTRLC